VQDLGAKSFKVKYGYWSKILTVVYTPVSSQAIILVGLISQEEVELDVWCPV